VKRWEASTLLGPLKRSNLNDGSSFQNVAVFEYRTMDKVEKLTNPNPVSVIYYLLPVIILPPEKFLEEQF
jgi:hypothetical protein